MSRKKRIFIFSALFALMCSSYFIVNTYAKYNSNVVAHGSTSIARWEVLIDSDEGEPINNVDVYIGGDMASYTLRVISNSDVASDYSVYFDSLPDDVAVAIDDSSFVTSVDGKATFLNVGSFDANQNSVTHTHVIKFKALDEAMEGTKLIDLDLKFVQKEIG